jgi:NADPH:quinone reductase-like Zn-dependent oxidoreductase
MRAIVLEKFGGPDSMVIKEIPKPEPRAGHVVIQVKAFGINHAEMHMLGSRLITNGDWRAFMGEGGYSDARLRVRCC